MDVNMTVIGEHAGLVWRTLENRHLSWDELLSATGLKPVELALAVGWLAREDKIALSQDGETMCLYFTQAIYFCPRAGRPAWPAPLSSGRHPCDGMPPGTVCKAVFSPSAMPRPPPDEAAPGL